MKFKDCKAIWITIETGKTFGYITNFKDNDLVGLWEVGSAGDIFPVWNYNEYNWKAEDEITFALMQEEFKTKVVRIECENISGVRTNIKSKRGRL